MKENRNSTRKPVSRRDFLKFASLVGGATVLAACAPKPVATQAPQATAPAPVTEDTQAPPVANATVTPTFVAINPAPAADQVEIEWWNQFTTPTCQTVFPQIVKNFQAENPKIVVKFEISGGPPGGGDYTQILLARIAAGNPPDSITLWTGPSQFGARGSLADIDQFMSVAKYAKPDAFDAGVLKTCQWNGKTYGLPASAACGCIFINKKTFDAAGVSTKREDFPTTWDGLRALSQKFTKTEGGTIKQVGYVPFTGASSWLKPVWSELNGGKIFDSASAQYKIDSPQNAEWLNYWIKWLKEEYGGDIEKLNQAGNWGDVYPNTAFALGNAAMADSGAWACTDAGIPFDWEVVKFPKGPSGSTQVTGFWPNWWAMPKGVPHAQEAFLFSEYMCTKGWGYWYEQATMDMPAWKNFPRDTLNKALSNLLGVQRATDVQNYLLDYQSSTTEMWTSPVEDFASDTLNSTLDEVLHLKTPADQALKQAQSLCQSKLDETLKGA
jgi:ABC-type glycerol-3-phosphate transport system substrate-binding protein